MDAVSVSPSPGAVLIRRSGEVPVLPHSVKLVGPVHRLRWPNVCVSCGAGSSERVPATRVFDRDWRFTPATRSPDTFRILAVQTIEVPVCHACAVRHRQQARPVGLLGTVLSAMATAWLIPVLVAVLGVLFHLPAGLLGPASAFAPAAGTRGQAAAFALAAVCFAGVAWHQTRHRRVTPPTVVTQAFDFSDDLAGIGGVSHRVYGMENALFARAFRDANHDRVWTEACRERSARRERLVAAALLLAAVLAAMTLAFVR